MTQMGFERSERSPHGGSASAPPPASGVVGGLVAVVVLLVLGAVVMVLQWESTADGPSGMRTTIPFRTSTTAPVATTSSAPPSTQIADAEPPTTSDRPTDPVPAPPTTGEPMTVVGGPATTVELAGIVLSSQSFALLQKPGVSAYWRPISRATSDNSPPPAASCDDEGPTPESWAQEQFAWMGSNVGIHGEATSRVMHFTTAADAAAYVEVRRTPEFATCLALATTAQFSKETGGQPVEGTVRQVHLMPVADGVARRYSADYVTPARRCQQFRDTYWVAAGTTVIAASLRTCGEPFSSAQERALIALQVAQLRR